MDKIVIGLLLKYPELTFDEVMNMKVEDIIDLLLNRKELSEV